MKSPTEIDTALFEGQKTVQTFQPAMLSALNSVVYCCQSAVRQVKKLIFIIRNLKVTRTDSFSKLLLFKFLAVR